MNVPKDSKINYAALSRYSTKLRKDFDLVKALNSRAVEASAVGEACAQRIRAWLAIFRFFGNSKSNKPGKKGYAHFLL